MVNKMSFANKHNQVQNLFTFEHSKDAPFIKPSDLTLGEVYQVRGMFTHEKGKYGTSGTIVLNDSLLSAPTHMVATIKEVLQDGESISLVNKGLVGIKSYTYQSASHGEQIGLEWVDIDNTPF